MGKKTGSTTKDTDDHTQDTQTTTTQSKSTSNNPFHGTLITKGAAIRDWDRACNAVSNLWERISENQNNACDLWYDMAKQEDPPPVWQSLLTTAVTIGLGAVTGGIGGVVAGKLVNELMSSKTKFLIDVAVKAGEGVINSATSTAVASATENFSTNGMLAFRESMKDSVSEVVRVQQEKTLGDLSLLARNEDGWKTLQSLYNAFSNSLQEAKTLQLQVCVDGWMRQLAQNEFGQDDGAFARMINEQTGKESNTSVDELEIAKDWGTSSIGTLGMHLQDRKPASGIGISYAEIESSAGVNEAIKGTLLGRKIKDLQFPRLAIGEMAAGTTGWVGANFSIAWDSRGDSGWVTYGGGAVALDSSNDNSGKGWLAGYYLGTNSPSNSQIVRHYNDGRKKLIADIGNKSLREWGITEISS